MKKILSICLVLFMFIVPLDVFADEPTKEDKVEILTEVVSNSYNIVGAR